MWSTHDAAVSKYHYAVSGRWEVWTISLSNCSISAIVSRAAAAFCIGGSTFLILPWCIFCSSWNTTRSFAQKIIWEQATSTPWWHTRWYPPCTIVQSYLPGGANVHGHLIHDSVGPPHSPSKTVARGSDQAEWPNSLVAIEATANYAASQKWGQMGWGEVIWGEMISVIL